MFQPDRIQGRVFVCPLKAPAPIVIPVAPDNFFLNQNI